MRNTDIACQVAHVPGAEDFPHHAAALPHRKRAARAGCNTGRILAAMLQQLQRVVEQLINRAGRHYPDYPAHRVSPRAVPLGMVRGVSINAYAFKE